MRRSVVSLIVGSIVAVGALLAAAMPAGATQEQLDGVGVFVEECGGETSLFTIAMDGSLQGCWYTDYLDGSSTPSGMYRETGGETFVGCLMEDGVEVACGSFQTTYRFTAKFAPTGEEIHGRCQHPIVAGSGTGGFEGITGRVDFKDDVTTGEFNFRGHIKFP